MSLLAPRLPSCWAASPECLYNPIQIVLMENQNRRSFLYTTTAAVLAGRALPVLGANDRINVAIVGIGGRGRDHVAELSKQPNCSVAAVGDVNQAAYS